MNSPSLRLVPKRYPSATDAWHLIRRGAGLEAATQIGDGAKEQGHGGAVERHSCLPSLRREAGVRFTFDRTAPI